MVARLVCPLDEGGSRVCQAHPFPSQQLHCVPSQGTGPAYPRVAAGKGEGQVPPQLEAVGEGGGRGGEGSRKKGGKRGGFNIFY